jgi:hypothetical protein
MLHTEKDQKRYLTIMADGKLHERVDEDTEGAKIRTKKEKDGTVVEVLDKEGNQIWELTYPGITATIKGTPKLREGEYGSNINIDLEDEEENQFVLSLKVDSQYGERFMEALPNIDLNEPVEFKGYSFKPKGKDQKVRGLNIYQGDDADDAENKILSAFATKDGDDWEVLIKGYPMPDPKKKYTSEKWTLFFGQRREWVLDYLLEAEMILPADAAETEETEDEDAEDEAEEAEETTAPAKKAVAKKSAAPAKKGAKKGDDDDF